jgi:hypothetical protein
MGQHNEASHMGESEKRRAENSRLEVDRPHDLPFEMMQSKIFTTQSDLTARYTAFTFIVWKFLPPITASFYHNRHLRQALGSKHGNVQSLVAYNE